MKLSEMISQLSKFKEELGDVEVLITDGFDALCYRGLYEIQPWKDDSGEMTVDIGIGSCRE